MIVSPELATWVFGQVVQIGLLTGIFFRLGSNGARLNNLEFRISKQEEKPC